MKDPYKILRLKEIELLKVEAEVEALRLTARLLSDDGEVGDDNAPASTRWTAPPRPLQVPMAANSDPQPEHAAEWKEKAQGWP
jgi:hypothetical protein